MTAYAEKRRFERVVVDIPVRWGLTPDCPKEGRVLSLSAGGCFIRTPEQVDPRRVAYLDLWVPGARPLAGEVRYRVGDYGLGVEFKGAGPLTAAMLAHLVAFYSEHREPES